MQTLTKPFRAHCNKYGVEVQACTSLTEEDPFSYCLQSKELDMRQIRDDVEEMEKEYAEQERNQSWRRESSWDYYRSYRDSYEDDWDGLSTHKAGERSFRKLRNQRFMPFRRYSNSFDGFEKSRDDSPKRFKRLREWLIASRREEVDAPFAAVLLAEAQYGSISNKKARRQLEDLGYFIDWRKDTDRQLAINRRRQHMLCEFDKREGAYSENPYAGMDYEPSWRRIGTYTPPTKAVEQPKRVHTAHNNELYDSRTGSYRESKVARPTAKSSGVVKAISGSNRGRIQVWRAWWLPG